ncbi:MAG: TonB-dependent vitamin B12 receptor [Pseudomonadota bacterium]
MNISNKPILAGILAASFSQSVIAQTNDDAIIVTASRTAQTVDDTLSSVTVFRREDIQRLQATSISDLLTGVNGVNITNNGGLGKTTSLFMRGTESDHLLVLIDGIKVGSATSGSTAFEDLPLDQIERIEIVRGPRSSLYGSEAIGGVIQIFTRKGAAGLKPSFNLGAGSYGTKSISASLSGGNENSSFNLSVGHTRTDGFDSCENTLTAGCFVIEPDNDGYKRNNASLHLGHRFANKAEVDFSLLQTQGENEYDGGIYSGNENDFKQQVLGVKAALPVTDTWFASATVGKSTDEMESRLNGTFVSEFNTTRNTASIQNDISIRDNVLLSVGIDYLEDEVSTSEYSANTRDNIGVFIQSQSEHGKHRLNFSLRQDDNEQFNTHTTGSVAWGYALNDNLSFKSSYGTAFKAPSFNELYYPYYGDVNLKPEESRTIEIGLSHHHQHLTWEISAYQTKVDDLIAYDASIFKANNINAARIQGLEVTAGARLDNWLLNTNFSLMKTKNESHDANNGNQLARRANNSLRIDIDHTLPAVQIGATINIQGSRYDDAANTVKVPGYSTIDLRLEKTLSKHWLMQAKVANLADKDYQTVAHFNQAGRNVMLNVKYQQ